MAAELPPIIPGDPFPGQLLTSNIAHIQEFVEVHTLNGARRTNPYLEAGYKLLGIYHEAEPLETESKQMVVRKRIVFVVGRTEDVAHFEPQPTNAEQAMALKRSQRPVQIPTPLATAD